MRVRLLLKHRLYSLDPQCKQRSIVAIAFLERLVECDRNSPHYPQLLYLRLLWSDRNPKILT
ncbi:MAG: hypothetical protein F6J89_10405 [Symploca sp. SIO1C4]|uniref:Uncharacterized protein n=1 Tax=Symploca sp. SIO1C4 TaxID=2607765 RepID=A0A6B3ND42_9CYAN|nr:hypothetical protein [Symploca sp. SIO1C4]